MRLNRSRAAVVKKYTETNQKMFMTLEESLELSHEIAERLQGIKPAPRMLVGIANGALLMTKTVADDLGLPMRMIRIRRKGSAAQDKLRKVPGLTALASAWYKVPTLNTPLRWVINRFNELDLSQVEEHDDVFPPRIALLDDVIQTGQTFKLAHELLVKGGCKNIISAVIVWSKTAGTSDDEGIVSNIYIGKTVQHFPWSGNSPYFKEYLNWLSCNGLEVES